MKFLDNVTVVIMLSQCSFEELYRSSVSTHEDSNLKNNNKTTNIKTKMRIKVTTISQCYCFIGWSLLIFIFCPVYTVVMMWL